MDARACSSKPSPFGLPGTVSGSLLADAGTGSFPLDLLPNPHTYVLGDLNGRPGGALASGSILLQHLAPNVEDLHLAQEITLYPSLPVMEASLPMVASKVPFAKPPPQLPQLSPGCTPWLLSDMLLVAVNAHSPPASHLLLMIPC
ncbi:hypothetical protein DSO57_1003630 [Entomophthora muscae]|uniref:Uncharacterized protein n=1 Tax=Entomophthora muscae TaxID=34485 RepID=A0ACC2SLI7_9FUNG|nr:hypothetical protein DSO57_1003630 [Entomophthora muscae]